MSSVRYPMDGVKLTIVSHTNDPVRSIAAAQLNMIGEMVHDLNDISRERAEDAFLDICKTELQGAFEFAHFNVQMEHVSRAFQQQLTRSRVGIAFSIESLRFNESGMEVFMGPHLAHMGVDKTGKEPSGYDDKTEAGHEARQLYVDTVQTIEEAYQTLLDLGVPTEDARGILPLNVTSKVGMCVSYKTLVHMSRVRMCYQSQAGEWGNVFQQLVSELEKIDPLLTEPLGAFCDVGQKCPFGSVLDRKCERRRAE